MKSHLFLSILAATALAAPRLTAGAYDGFQVSVYARAYEVREMNNLPRLDSLWNIISRQVKTISRIYLS